MAPILGYWCIRGLAEPIRNLLRFADVKFEDKQYSEPNGWEEWAKDKEALGLDFPNLPYYIDGDLKITETTAILSYLARKHKLDGGCSEDNLIRVDMAMSIILDVLKPQMQLCYNPEFATAKIKFLEGADKLIAKMTSLLRKGPFILGEKVCSADFLLLETVERYVLLIPDLLDSHPELKEFHKKMTELPAIAKYRATDGFQKIKNRFNAPFAAFGSGM